ncbi:MAG: hypothetical protein OEW04_03090 [Nitrospirota bacterium]|nr:hypothetical protein [Nitrospirota bacterium]
MNSHLSSAMIYNRYMRIGSRIVRPDEVGLWPAEILQISVYRGMKDSLVFMRQCAVRCREARLPYVIHPINFSLFDEEAFRDLREMAEWSDLGMILHDERTAEGRVKGGAERLFREALAELASKNAVSFENATDTGDVLWFWAEYADSITIDLGHVEAWGLDSVAFVQGLDEAAVRKVEYVHMHRNNGWRSGLTDHWPLTRDCREVMALRELLRRKRNVGVLLEINETDRIPESLEILRELRDGC